MELWIELEKVIEIGDLKELKDILDSMPYDINKIVTPSKESLLHIAVLCKKLNIIEELLSRGIDTNAKASRGNNCFHYFVSSLTNGYSIPDKKDEEILDLLVSVGGDINIQNNYGNSAFTDAVRSLLRDYKSNELIKLFLKYPITQEDIKKGIGIINLINLDDVIKTSDKERLINGKKLLESHLTDS